jgi:8-oxo-dGTP pyrophosphatase MutT (NUDIX family)
MTIDYTHPDVLGAGVAQGWADPETDPTRIDWPARQARALIPFEVIGGRPVNPGEKTAVRYGRNELGHWGEQAAADALVDATDQAGRRWIIMVERSDGYGWALPGGYIEPGEDPVDAAIRELHEETELLAIGRDWQASAPRYVPDPRASDESWMVSVLARCHLGEYHEHYMPEVVGADDAKWAAWVRADSYDTLAGYLTSTYGGRVFRAHRAMLADALG